MSSPATRPAGGNVKVSLLLREQVRALWDDLGDSLGDGAEGVVVDYLPDPSLVAKVFYGHSNNFKCVRSVILSTRLTSLFTTIAGDPPCKLMVWPGGIRCDGEDVCGLLLMPRFDGDLVALVHSKRLSQNPRCYLSMAVSLLKQLVRLHAMGYVHYDIKADNIMFRIVNGKVVVRLADFGFASRRFGLHRGTTGYVAPELTVVDKRPTANAKVDVYSLGMTLRVCCLHRNGPEFREFDALVQDMLECDPNERPSAVQALSRASAALQALGRLRSA